MDDALSMSYEDEIQILSLGVRGVRVRCFCDRGSGRGLVNLLQNMVHSADLS